MSLTSEDIASRLSQLTLEDELEKDISLSSESIAEKLNQQEQQKQEESLGDAAAELALETGFATAGQAVAIATGPFYLPVAFGTGFFGSILAQSMTGDGDVSLGQAWTVGTVNTLPFGSAAKGVTASTKITKEIVKEAAKIEAKRGAAIGAGEATAKAIIDEGRLPTMEELAVYGVGGGAFGSLLGAATPKISKSFQKFLGKNPEQIDADVAAGKITEQDVIDTAGQVQPAKEVRRVVDDTITTADKRAAEATLREANAGEPVSWFKSALAKVIPSRITGREVQDVAFYTRRGINAVIEEGSKIQRSVDAQIKKDDSLRPLVNKFLETGSIDNKIKGTKLAGDLERYAEVRDKLQNKLVNQLETLDFGRNYEQSQALLKAVKDSIRDKNYNTREYRLFTDSNFKINRKLQAEAQKEIAQSIINKKPNLSEKQAMDLAEEHIQKLLSTSAAAKKLNPNTYIPSSTDGILRFRHDVGPAERAFLGEITDAGERMRGTLTGLAKIVYRNEADVNVARALERLGLATRNPPDLNTYTKLNLKGDIQTDLYVPNNVELALSKSYLARMDELSNDIVRGAIADTYSTAVGLSKAAKVLFNPPSYAVNAYGGLLTMIGSGINPFTSGYGKGLKFALAEFGNIENLLSKGGAQARKALLKDMQEMTKYGLSAANIVESDIRDAFNQGVFGRVIGKKLEPFGKAYAVTDTAARYAVWTGNQQKLSKMFPDLKGEELKIAAAKLTNDTFQNYDKLSPIIRQASRTGFLPQFVSFTAEFMRNIYNQTRYAKQMVMGNFGAELGLNPSSANIAAMRKEGLTRLTALSTVIAGTEALRRSLNTQAGIESAEQEQAYRDTALPDFDKNKSIVFMDISEDGKTGSYINFSYISPHAMIAEAMNAAISNQPLESLGDILVENFVGEGNFVLSSVYDAIDNMDDNGNPITVETKKLARFKDQLKFVARDTFKTGAEREIEKVIAAINTEEPEYSFSDIAKRQLGVRIRKFDVEQSAKFKMRSHKEAAKFAASEYNKARDYDNLSPQALQDVYENANRIRKDNLYLISKNNNDLARLGYTEAERIEVMKSSGVSSKDILAILENRYNQIPLQKTLSTSDTLDGADYQGLSVGQTFAKIAKEARQDPALGKRLRDEYKRRLIAERRGVTSKDSLIKNMTTSERADYVQANPQRFQEFRRKGIVNRNVMIELRRRGVLF